jgi:hypothetical protein
MLDLDAIEARLNGTSWMDTGELLDAVPALVAEVRRLRVLLADVTRDPAGVDPERYAEFRVQARPAPV